jgi:hypothetical protein
LADAFERSQREADSAMNELSPEEVLVQYLPSSAASIESSDATTLPPSTPPTSMSIHNEAAADVSDIATRASTDEATLLWGIGNVFGGSSALPDTQSRKAGKVRRHLIALDFHELPPWLRTGFVLLGMLVLTLALHGLRLIIADVIAFTSFVDVDPAKGQSTTFQATYFHTLPQSSLWKRLAILINGLIWLVSLFHLMQSFQGVLAGQINNRIMQIRLLKTTSVWLAYSGIDGMLRLRSREEISISMMTILMLMLFLSTSAKNLASPSAA